MCACVSAQWSGWVSAGMGDSFFVFVGGGGLY